MQEFTEQLEALLQETASNNSTSIVCLDSNINAHTAQSHPQHLEYFQTILTNGYLQCINKSTRIQGSTHTLIDHILTNTKAQKITSGTLISDISDHFITFIVASTTQHHRKVGRALLRNFSAANVERFREGLSSTDWSGVMESTDVNVGYTKFTEKFDSLYSSCFPASQPRFNKNIHKLNNFMSKALLVSRQTKHTLHKQAILHPTQENIAKYKEYRNAFNRTVRASKRKYFEENLLKSTKDPRKTWNLIKEALNSNNNESQTIEKLECNGTIITDKKEMANAFGEHFASAGLKVAQAINTTQHTAAEYLPHPCEHELHLGTINNAEVVSVLRAMQPKSSQDINGLSMKILKQVAMEVSIPLTHIFNLSLTHGTFPDQLKTSRIVPIYKGGRKDQCDNYRPVALLNTLTKALEKIVAAKLTQHITSNNLLYEGQFGFQKGRNTEQNLIYTITNISNSINNGNYCIGVFLDLKKAFDVCSHEIMLQKLDNFGVRGTALQWFKSYLSNRKQSVDIQGQISDQQSIEGISIIQGGTLGPILFNIYINDLHRCTTLLTALFADDTAALNSGKNLPALIDNTNTELEKIAEWFRANKMAVNTSKTKYIIFHTKGKKIETQGKNIIFNDNERGNIQENRKIFTLERIHSNHIDKNSRAYKLLGIHLDEHLTFDTNTQALVSKLSKSVYSINRVKHYLPQKALLSIYHALVHSHLKYCTTIASSTSKSNIEKISKMQKKAIRAVMNAQYNAHTPPLLAKLGILPYKDMITQAQLTIMHSVHYSYAPTLLRELWHRNADRDTEHNLRNAQDYTIPRAHYAFYTRTPAYAFAKAWNTASAARHHHNPTTFSINIRNELLGQYISEPPEYEHLAELRHIHIPQDQTPTQSLTQTQAQTPAHTQTQTQSQPHPHPQPHAPPPPT